MAGVRTERFRDRPLGGHHLRDRRVGLHRLRLPSSFPLRMDTSGKHACHDPPEARADLEQEPKRARAGDAMDMGTINEEHWKADWSTVDAKTGEPSTPKW